MNKSLRPLKQQAGIVMLVTLICLVILMLASVALVRSTDTNLVIAGNMAFKRDVVNQAERAIPTIKTLFTGGALFDATVRQNDLVSNNYYASIQTNNSKGIPNVLMAVTDGNANNILDTNAQIIVRYVIDRMCLSTGPVSPTSCSLSKSTTNPGGGGNNPPVPGPDVPVYRISIRATGPSNTEAFVQSTFSF